VGLRDYGGGLVGVDLYGVGVSKSRLKDRSRLGTEGAVPAWYSGNVLVEERGPLVAWRVIPANSGALR
jgi:hypothetical protein